MDIKMNDTSGVTLKTAGKYCTEDIVVTPNFEIGITPTGSIEITENGTYDVTDKASAVVNVESDLQSKTITENGTYTPDSGYDGFNQVTVNVAGSGGSSDLVEVEALPTENVDASKIYVVNKATDIEVYFCYGSGYLTLAEAVADGLGFAPTIYYEVVSELPASPNATDLQVFNPIYCYIYNNVAYVYGNAGAGDMWLTVSALFAQMGETIEDKGRTYDIAQETAAGLYTYWTGRSVGTPIANESFSLRNSQWINYGTRYKNILFRDAEEITEDDLMGLEKIYAYMFSKAEMTTGGSYAPLKSIIMPNTIRVIGTGAFFNCEYLEEVFIPEGVRSINERAFWNCRSLTSIVIPNSVTGIDSQAFDGCKSLQSVVLSNSLTYISNMLFQDCNSLTSVEIPNGVTRIGSSAFKDCWDLTSIEIPNSATSLQYQAFQNCFSLTSIIIGNSVTSIGYNAFENCTSLTSIVIPNSVTSLGEAALSKCSKLTSIVIGSGVTLIQNSVFNHCTACLLYDFSNHTEVPTLRSTSAFSSINANAKIVVPDSLYDSWITATNWGIFTDCIVKASEYTA